MYTALEPSTMGWIPSLLVFLPALGALLLAFFPSKNAQPIRLFTLAVTLAVLAGVVGFFLLDSGTGLAFDVDEPGMQSVYAKPWIPTFHIQYLMGMDGISFPLVVLTAFVTALAMGASWSITKNVKAYCILFLLLETGMLGVFMALDFFLFYVFWEVMLLPMYFLIGVWGGPRKEYAAIKFFLYTLLGSVLMLIAILMLYFNSDVNELVRAQPDKIATLSLPPEIVAAADGAEGKVIHTFNLMALAAMGQHTDLFSQPMLFGWTLQHWAFVLLFIGFAVKVPSVPVHTWLPDAHVEAPTPISMILAGVLLKMGGYGIIRICYPICPQGGFDFAWCICLLGVVSMIYGALAAMAQKDFKRLVAYSSVSHMGYVVLGLGVWSAAMAGGYIPDLFQSDSWNMGIQGAMFQMIGHGVSSAGMFFMVGVIYDRVHHRNLDQFGGLFGKMPLYTGLAIPLFFAGLGLPGLCGFIGEVLVVLSVWKFSIVLAVLSAAVVVLTAGYILWAIQRVYLGPEYKGPHPEALSPITLREVSVAVPLVFFAILFGVAPSLVLRYMDESVTHQVTELTDWAERYVRTKDQPTDPVEIAVTSAIASDNDGGYSTLATSNRLATRPTSVLARRAASEPTSGGDKRNDQSPTAVGGVADAPPSLETSN